LNIHEATLGQPPVKRESRSYEYGLFSVFPSPPLEPPLEAVVPRRPSGHHDFQGFLHARIAWAMGHYKPDIQRPWILCVGGSRYYDHARDPEVMKEAFAEMEKASAREVTPKFTEGLAITAVAIAERGAQRTNKRLKEYCELASVEIGELMEHIDRRMARMQSGTEPERSHARLENAAEIDLSKEQTRSGLVRPARAILDEMIRLADQYDRENRPRRQELQKISDDLCLSDLKTLDRNERALLVRTWTELQALTGSVARYMDKDVLAVDLRANEKNPVGQIRFRTNFNETIQQAVRWLRVIIHSLFVRTRPEDAGQAPSAGSQRKSANSTQRA
jgi:hypothetical protein